MSEVIETKIKFNIEFCDAETIKLHTDFMGTITTQVMRTREKMIRDALISLGWTPPVKVSDALTDAGYVIVPRKPTEPMISAGEYQVCGDEHTARPRAINTYLSMIGAVRKS